MTVAFPTTDAAAARRDRDASLQNVTGASLLTPSLDHSASRP